MIEITLNKNLGIFVFDAPVPRSEVVFMSQMILFLNLINFCIYTSSLTQLSCKETSVWFSWVLASKPKDMNKNFDMSTRLFLAVVGPSQSGKSKLIFKLLKGRTFHPKFGRL